MITLILFFMVMSIIYSFLAFVCKVSAKALFWIFLAVIVLLIVGALF
jgi:hypothetical protein